MLNIEWGKLFMTNKIKGNKGFTLIEIIVALAILALLSGSLLQSFVLSAQMNSKADDIDKANMLATSIVENFKAGTNAITFKNYEAFYKRNWTLTDDSTEGAYRLTVTITPKSTPGGNNVFTPPNDNIVIPLDSSASDADHDGFIENNMVFNNQIDINHDNRLSVRIDYPLNDSKNYEIFLTNNTIKPIDLYVYGANDKKVKLTPISGESTITYIPEPMLLKDTNLTEFTLKVIIVRISDGVRLCSYSTSKYIAQ